jgi:catechol 2,3-dioxygenase-like lactoylglutathione lyase family enzyme
MPESLSLQQLHHIAVPTSDPERCAEFYQRVLGMQRIPRPDFSFGGAWMYHASCNMQIHIIEHSSAGDRGEIDSLAGHFAVRVSDMDASEALLNDHGIPYQRKVNAGSIPQIFFHDPDGNMIELGIYSPDMQQRDGFPSRDET